MLYKEGLWYRFKLKKVPIYSACVSIYVCKYDNMVGDILTQKIASELGSLVFFKLFHRIKDLSKVAVREWNFWTFHIIKYEVYREVFRIFISKISLFRV